MAYQGSAVCRANRVHFCQYCNTIYSYPISKNLSVSGSLTRESAAGALEDQANAFIQHYVEAHECPHCGQYQTIMAYQSLSKFCIYRFLTVIVLLFALNYYLFNDWASASFSYLKYLLFCLPFWIEIIWQCFVIRKFYGKKAEQMPESVIDDAREEYRFQRKTIQRLKLFLCFGFLCGFIPVFGMSIAGCVLLTYYLIVYLLPGRFRSQGLPLYSRDVRIS